ncbi:TIGR03086 family protein [Rhodococcus erythropolis]|uniref:TIGR03086 family metal-binding protein n=1 Tax=Rhodococcus erythropolis TaxID=1833 RepID=UPI0008A334BE|nr:TIGR03086 family metal-binding protein [Rhodococcus erythropolis]MBT1257633.1 TIGR03086 family protein [Rhodococcus erythropolis]OHF27264.1 TIGR03086 family protein [Rhodococcus erythropolis]
MTSTEIFPAQRYRDLAAGFTARIDAVPADRWDNASPCEGWTARDVVRHVLDSERDMVKVVGLELAPGPSVDDDPSAAWAAVRDSMQAILDDPAKSTLEYDGHFGRTNLGATVEGFLCFDLVIHGWDLAAATGTDTTMRDTDVEWVSEIAAGLGESIRMGGVCGPEIQVPDNADKATKLLAFLGRKA